jgi:hypothetical protein
MPKKILNPNRPSVIRLIIVMVIFGVAFFVAFIKPVSLPVANGVPQTENIVGQPAVPEGYVASYPTQVFTLPTDSVVVTNKEQQ